MKKKILKIYLTNNRNIYPTQVELESCDIYINRFGVVFDNKGNEINDMSFQSLSQRQVLNIYLVGIEEPIKLEQLITIQQFDLIKYLYNYFGSDIKLVTTQTIDASLLIKLIKNKYYGI